MFVPGGSGNGNLDEFAKPSGGLEAPPDSLNCDICEVKASDAPTGGWMALQAQEHPSLGIVIKVAAFNPDGPDLCLRCYRTGVRLYPAQRNPKQWVPVVLAQPSTTALFLQAVAVLDNMPQQQIVWVPSEVHSNSSIGMRVKCNCAHMELSVFLRRFKNPPEAFGLTAVKIRNESNVDVEGTFIRLDTDEPGVREVKLYYDTAIHISEQHLSRFPLQFAYSHVV